MAQRREGTPARIEDRFDGRLNPIWEVAEVGGGSVRVINGALHLTVQPTGQQAPKLTYSNAQITDYGFKKPHEVAAEGRPAPGGLFQFAWRPPVRMEVTAWALADHAPAGADDLRGTAGFGFWNHPFSPDVRRLPRLPQAIWFFFASPPNDMQLALGVPGWGWKAALIDAATARAALFMPLAVPAALLMRIPALYHRLYPSIQRAFKISEALLDGDLLKARHTYVLDWRADSAAFSVDGAEVLRAPYAPHGRVGFVAWLDNQYAIVTPQGRVGFGAVPVERAQTLVIDHILIEGGA